LYVGRRYFHSRHPPGHFGEASGSHTNLGQRIIGTHVEAQGDHQGLGAKILDRRRHLIKAHKDLYLVITRCQHHIQVTPFAFAFAAFVGVAGEVRWVIARVSVHGSGEHVSPVIEDIFRTVPGVRVHVQDSHLGKRPAQFLGRHGSVIDEAEPIRRVPGCMVPRRAT